MSEKVRLGELFEEQRPRLRAVAYRMLGSVAEADDAVQEAWLRLDRTDAAEIDNLAAWLTTVVSRICLNGLRSREQRREDPLEFRLPDPVVSREDGGDPEHEAVMADSIGLAMMVVLDTLTPAERLAFVLHDLFSVPFEEIAPLIEKTAATTRQLASRGRRKVRDQAPRPDQDLARQRAAVEAFFAAIREGDFDALVSVLDPDVVIRSDGGAARARMSLTFHGAKTVASQAVMFANMAPYVRPALVNGAAGVVVVKDGSPFAIMAFSVVDDLVVSIEVLNDPDRLTTLDLSAFGA